MTVWTGQCIMYDCMYWSVYNIRLYGLVSVYFMTVWTGQCIMYDCMDWSVYNLRLYGLVSV